MNSVVKQLDVKHDDIGQFITDIEYKDGPAKTDKPTGDKHVG